MSLHPLLPACFGLLFLEPLAGDHGLLLSRIKARAEGSVIRAAFSPDGTTVFYLADQDSQHHYQLYSAPVDGSAEPTAISLEGVSTFECSPDGSWLVFQGESLYSLSLAGSAPALLLAPRSGVFERFEISSDSARVVYTAGGAVHSAPIDAGGGPTQLCTPIAEPEWIGALAISPDSTSVVYGVFDSQFGYIQRLMGVPIAGGAPVQVSAPFSPDQDLIHTYAFSPDSAWIVYTVNRNDGSLELHSAPSDGSGSAVQLSSPGTDVLPDPLLSASAARVVYQAQDALGLYQLYSVPIDGSAAPLQLNATLPPGGSTGLPALSPDGTRVVYVAEQDTDGVFELYSVPADGSGSPVKLNPTLAVGANVSSRLISPDGARVVYVADQDTDGVRDMYSVPIDGSAAAVRLVAGSGPGGLPLSFPTAISADGASVVYVADEDSAGVSELYRVPIDGSAAPLKLSPTPVTNGNVLEFVLSAAGERVAYLANQDQVGTIEIYCVPIDGSMPARKLSRAGDPGPLGGDVERFGMCGSRAIYLADPLENERTELFSVAVDGSSPPIKLNAGLPIGGDVHQWESSPRDQRVVFTADRGGTVDLFSRRIDGVGLPIPLNPRPVAGGRVFDFAVAPRGSRVVYRANQATRTVPEIYVVAIDGTGPAARLNANLVAGGQVLDYAIDSGGARVVYRADQGANERFELYSRPLDRSAPAVRLNGNLVTNGDVLHAYAIDPTGTRVVYLADQTTNDVLELYSVPIDGSAPAVELHTAPGAPPFVNHFVLDPLGARVVYQAEAVGGAKELYSAPLDGSAVSVRLDSSFPVVFDYEIDPLGQRVCYRAGPFVDAELDLFSVPIDGSAGPVRLNSAPATHAVGDFVFDRAGSRVVFEWDVEQDGGSRLFRVPIDGSSPPVALTPPDVDAYSPRILGGDVFYRTARELLRVPLAGGASTRLTPPLAPGGHLWGFPFETTAVPFAAGRIVYMAEHELAGVTQLYSSRIVPPVRRR